MNRRNFLSNLAKSFFILPGAGRVYSGSEALKLSGRMEEVIE